MKEDNGIREEIDKLEGHLTREILSKYPLLKITESGEYFTESFNTEELRCGCLSCNKEVPHKIEPKRLHKIQEFRDLWGSPFRPNSAYRCELHPDERKKDKPGEHTRGAMDVPLRGGAQRMKFVQLAIEVGATGIGVANTFGHLDFRITTPMLWRY